MRLLIKERQSGKTTGLIYASEVTGYPIAVLNEGMVGMIKDMANQMGCIIPEPVTFSELRRGSMRGKLYYENILIDEAQFVLNAALNEYFHCNVIGATITDTLKELDGMRRNE